MLHRSNLTVAELGGATLSAQKSARQRPERIDDTSVARLGGGSVVEDA
jgi:hypothetical protein